MENLCWWENYLKTSTSYSNNKMYKHDCLDGNRNRRLPVFVFHNNMFRGCVENHMKHKCCKSYYLCFGVYYFAISYEYFINYTRESTGNIQKSTPNQISHVFMEICHLTAVLAHLIRCRENLLPSDFWLSTHTRKNIRPGGFWRQSLLKKTIEKASFRTGQNETIK